MSKLYIIDGNNLLHTLREYEALSRKWDFEEARHKMVHRMREFAGESDVEVILIYDGTVGGHAPEYQVPGFRVIFSSAESSADSLIEKLVADSPRSEQITVVTSDRIERYVVKASGAFVVSCRNFIELLNDSRTNTEREITRSASSAPRATMGDLFPDK
jgi:predicted RNA-binding protein with PIN domain